MTVETLSTLVPRSVSSRQTIMPDHQYGSYVADDTDNHDFLFAGRGKAIITVAIDNPSDKNVVWDLYGMHEADGEVGDAGTFEVDMTNTVTQGTKGNATNTNAYPYYLLRCTSAQVPNGSTVSVYIDKNIGT